MLTKIWSAVSHTLSVQAASCNGWYSSRKEGTCTRRTDLLDQCP